MPMPAVVAGGFPDPVLRTPILAILRVADDQGVNRTQLRRGLVRCLQAVVGRIP